MAVIEIKSRFSGEVLFSAEAKTIAACLLLAIASRANLSGANLSGAYLSGADLYGANLSGANLSGAYLSGANLSGADLSGANLSRADLSGADLSGADLYGADLSRADLYGADLSGADLYGADLSRADLSGADLSGAKNAEAAVARTRILPEGSLIGWKACRDNVLVKLRIPEEAKRSHAFGRKCRAEWVEVLEVIGADVGVSQHDRKVTYRAGEIVRPDSFDDNWQDECSNGIHFFITRAEAEAYK
jgi:hypothetical protein